MKYDQRKINVNSHPSGTGCVECSKEYGWWYHLRRCAECGHIGCCDSSPGQHASQHAALTGHHVIVSFEPGETWFYDYKTKETFEGPDMPPPYSHPKDQPAPGPDGRVPRNWLDKLH
jgi:hypothetical protein